METRPGLTPPIPQPPPPFDPVAAATRLGAPVAVLVTPKGLCQVGGVSFDSVHHWGPPMQLPVRAEVSYRFDSENFIASTPAVGVLMYTRRQQPALPERSLREHIEDALVDYQLSFASRIDTPPWATEQDGRLRPPRQLVEQLHRPRIGWRHLPVTVDGREVSWDYLAEQDIATDEMVVARGGQVGEVLVAVAGPERLLATGVSIGTVHPQ